MAPASQVACDRIQASAEDGLSGLRSLPVHEALDEVDELSWIASAMRLPDVQTELDRFDAVTIFAPLDEPLEQDTADATDEAAAPQTRPGDVDIPPQAFLVLDGALTVEQLLDEPVELADGGTLSTEIVDEQAVVEREEARTPVVCADVQLEGAVLHVLDGVPYPHP